MQYRIWIGGSGLAISAEGYVVIDSFPEKKSKDSYKGIIVMETSYTPWLSFFLTDCIRFIYLLKDHQANAELPIFPILNTIN